MQLTMKFIKKFSTLLLVIAISGCSCGGIMNTDCGCGGIMTTDVVSYINIITGETASGPSYGGPLFCSDDWERVIDNSNGLKQINKN